MAVANFHYITRMSSGFKVYILEGQSHLRSEDRFRHIANDRARVPTVYPLKRKRSHERGLTLEERRERVLSRSIGKAAQKALPSPAPAAFNRPQSPTSTWSPTGSPANPGPRYGSYGQVMDEPLALIKKPRQQPESAEEKSRSSTATQIQMRPSVITCVSSSRSPPCRPEVHGGPPSVISRRSCDRVVDEHFQRSLGVDYPAPGTQPLSISVSVDDHFAKALGDKWLQIKSKSSSCSSTPPSSPSVTQSPAYSHSPNRSLKELASSSPSAPGHWPVN